MEMSRTGITGFMMGISAGVLIGYFLKPSRQTVKPENGHPGEDTELKPPAKTGFTAANEAPGAAFAAGH